tara:strand:+ start:5468 stop:13597 length:8130 start_codon:yes stop_codon:yes gene_type:complete
MSNYIITGSITGSFTSEQTANVSFYAKGGNNEMKHYVRLFGYNNSGSLTGSADHTLFSDEGYGIGTAWGKKSFTKAIPASIEAVKVLLTGSIDGGGTLIQGKPEINLSFDKFNISVYNPKAEMTSKGLFVFSTPDRYIRIDKNGMELRGGEINAQKILVQDLEVFGDTTVFGDITSVDLTPYTGSNTDIFASQSTDATHGDSIYYARGDHTHKIGGATIDTTLNKYEFSNPFTQSGLHVIGDGFISGTLEVIDLVTTAITSSVITLTGSNDFGDSASQDTHHFTGSVQVSGSGHNFFGTNITLSASNSVNVQNTLYASSSNKVGIGTADPAYTLEVKASANDDGILLRAANGQLLALLHQQDTDAGMLRLYDASSTEKIVFNADANQTSYFNNGGNVGIGTNSAPKSLTVEGSISSSGILYLRNNQSFSNEDSSGTARNTIKINGSDEVEIGTTTLTGNVLIKNNSGISGSSVSTASFGSIELAGTTKFYIGGSGGGTATDTLAIGSRGTVRKVQMELYHASNPVSLGLDYNAGSALAYIESVHSSYTQNVDLLFKPGGSESWRIGGRGSDYAHDRAFQIKPTSNDYDFELVDTSDNPILYSDTGNQRIGIGTSSPTATLDVRTDGGTSPNIFVTGSNSGHIFDAKINNDQRFRIDNSGNINFSVGTTSAKVWNTGAGGLSLSSNSTEEDFFIKSDGNVGIGTTTPGEKLEVIGNISGSSTSTASFGRILLAGMDDQERGGITGTSGSNAYGGIAIQAGIGSLEAGNTILKTGGTYGNSILHLQNSTNGVYMDFDIGNTNRFIIQDSFYFQHSIANNLSTIWSRYGDLEIFSDNSTTGSVNVYSSGSVKIYASGSKANTFEFTTDNQLTGNATSTASFGRVDVGGDIVATGNVIAKTYVVSSSVTHQTNLQASGSSKFGDTLDDIHQFTGSADITGSLKVDTGDNTITLGPLTSGQYTDIRSTGTLFIQGGTNGVTQVGGDFIPTSTRLKDLGSVGREFQEAYIVSSSVSQSIVNDNLIVGGIISASGDLYLENNSKIIWSGSNEQSGYIDVDTSALELRHIQGTYEAGIQLDTRGNIKFANLTNSSNPGSNLSYSDDLKMIISESNGYVGIGTATPGEKLEIFDGTLLISGSHISHSGAGTQKPSGGDWQRVLRLGDSAENGFSTFIQDGGTSQYSLYTNRWGARYHWFRGSEDVDGEGNTLQQIATLYGHDTGQYFRLYDGTSGTVKVQLSATGSDTYFNYGNVGINTTTPAYKLEVKNTSANAELGITGANTDARLVLTSNESSWLVQNDYSNAGALSFYNGTGGHTLVIAEAGNVGIGTTSPSVALQVEGKISSSDDLRVYNGSNSMLYDVSQHNLDFNGGDVQISAGAYNINFLANTDGNAAASDAFRFATGSNAIPLMVMEAEGHIGINTDSPGVNLDVKEATNSALIDINQASTGTGTDAGVRFKKNDTIKGTVGYNAGSDVIQLGYGNSYDNSATINIDSSGRVGIGTPNPDYTLDVNGDIGINQYLKHNGNDNTLIGFNTDKIELHTGGNIGIVVDSSQRVGIGKSTAAYTLDVGGDAAFKDSIGTSSFASGFAGYGWRIDKESDSGWGLSVDELTVRGTFNVYELLINQTRATNGSIWVSSTGKVESVTAQTSPSFSLSFDTGSNTIGHGFAVGDLIRAQRYQGSDSYQSDLIVVSVESTGSLVAITTGSTTHPSGGFEYVRIGNAYSSSRQGAVYMTADDDNAPYIDVIDGVTSHSDFNSSNNIKARLGKMDGISDSTFGNLSGYGLYSENVYLTGGIKATFGDIGGFGITATALSSSDKSFVVDSENLSIRLGDNAVDMTLDSSSGIFMSGSGDFRVGNPDTDQFRFVDGNLEITASQINLSGSGVGIDTNTFELGTDGLDISSTNRKISLGEDKIILSGSEIPIIKLDGGEISASDFFVSTQGQMTASAGKVAGFDINGNTLVGGTMRLNADDDGYFEIGGLSGVDEEGTTKTGSFFGGNGYVLMKAGTTADSNYIKLKNGELKLNSTNVDISGSDINIETENLTASGSNVEILTPSFFFGNSTSYISGSANGLELSSSEFNLDTTNLTIDSVNEKIDLGGEIVLQAGSNPKISISGSKGSDTIKLEQSAGTSTFGIVKSDYTTNDSGLWTSVEENQEFKFNLGDATNRIRFDSSGLDIETSKFELETDGVDISSTHASMSLGEGKIILSGSSTPVIKIDGGEISASDFFVSTTGEMTATAGAIGGWVMDSSTLYSNNNVYLQSSMGGKVYFGNGNYDQAGTAFSGSGEGFVANNSMSWDSSGNLQLTASRVDISGSDINIITENLTASGSNVEIITPSFFLGSATNNISSSNDDLSITTKNLTASGSSIEMLSPNVFLGEGSTNFISSSGGNLEISSSNFHLKNGNITASNVDLSGKITATSGEFAGDVIATHINTDSGSIGKWVIDEYGLRSSNKSGGGDGSFTSAGIRLNQAGWISAPKFYISSSGDVALSGSLHSTDANIGGWNIDSEKIKFETAGVNKLELHSISSSIVSLGMASSSIGGQLTTYAMVGSFGQTWRGSYSGNTGIDVGRYSISDGYKSLFRIDEISQSIAGWNFDDDSLYSGQVFLSGSANLMVVKDSFSRDVVEVGIKALQSVSPSGTNLLVNFGFEEDSAHDLTPTVWFVDTTANNGVDQFQSGGSFSNRIISLQVEDENPATGTKHYRIKVNASNMTG